MILRFNSDIGEGFPELDQRLLPFIDEASVGCAAHAGTPSQVQDTLARCRDQGIPAGAHPGYPDPKNFGRVETNASPGQIRETLNRQLDGFATWCDLAGLRPAHFKAHGALYHRLLVDEEALIAAIETMADFGINRLFLPTEAKSAVATARIAGCTVVREIFADRAYLAEGGLVSRDDPAAVLGEIAAILERMESLVQDGGVTTRDGSFLSLDWDSVCLHGDNPAAVAAVALWRDREQKR